MIESLCGEYQGVLWGEQLLRRTYLQIACSGHHLLGSSPGRSREFEVGTVLARKDLFIYLYNIRLGRDSVVGKLSGEKRLINLVYVENQ